MSDRRRFTGVGLAVVGGLLVAAALPPWGWWPAAFAGVALFAAALDRPAGAKGRAGRGWLFAAAWLAPGMAWMWFLSAPGYAVAVGVYGGYHAAAAALPVSRRWAPVARPAAQTLAEALRFCFPFGGVPLASLPIGQAVGPFAGVVRVGGVVLLTWFVFQAGWALAEVRRNLRRATVLLAGPAVVLVVAVIAPSGFEPAGPAWRVAAVQGGGEQGTHAVDTNSREVTEAHLDATSTIQPGTANLVVWPENVIDVDDFETSDAYRSIAAEAERIGAPFAVGVTEETDDDRFTNAQVAIATDGTITGRYEKVRRVPFGEYMPLRGLLDALGAPTDLVPRDAVAGSGPAVLDIEGGLRTGVVISWEVFFGGRANDGVSNGGQLILNPTNGSSYTWTILQTQQIASSRLRALEQGRWVVQVAPTGFSAFVSPDGDVLERTAISEQRVIYHDVVPSRGRTWYSHVGDIPFVALAALVVVAGLLDDRRRGRSSDVDDHGDRAVVDQFDEHLGAEPARGNLGTEPA